jgi:hypothetical protein
MSLAPRPAPGARADPRPVLVVTVTTTRGAPGG